MTARAKQRGQVLILLAAWLFFAGSGSSALLVYDHPVSKLKDGVKHAIADAGKKDAILADISQWEAIQDIRYETVNDNREKLLKRLRRQDTKRAELEPILAKLDTSFVVMDSDFLDLRFRVKARLTSDEWANVTARAGR